MGGNSCKSEIGGQEASGRGSKAERPTLGRHLGGASKPRWSMPTL